MANRSAPSMAKGRRIVGRQVPQVPMLRQAVLAMDLISRRRPRDDDRPRPRAALLHPHRLRHRRHVAKEATTIDCCAGAI